MSILKDWREQYDRMNRGWERLREVANGEVMASSAEARDLLLHFFQEAYHLKDWLKNDPSVALPIDGSMIEAWITDTPVMSICADLANTAKHLDLQGPRDPSIPAVFRGQGVTVRPGSAA